MGVRKKKAEKKNCVMSVKKTPTGISGLDEVSGGGFPENKLTLICGGPGCGKSLMGINFIVDGCLNHGIPGVIVSFEEDLEALQGNVESVGFDLKKLAEKGVLFADYVEVCEAGLQNQGEKCNLDGLLVRLEYAINKVNAKRVFLDSPELLYASLTNEKRLRSELLKIIKWLKQHNVTIIMSAEQGDAGITRYGIQEYIADAVFYVDHRVENQISTRRIRIIKYRGSSHGTNEYPFIIGDSGLSVLPITSLSFDHMVSNKIISTGVKGIDEMFDKHGIYAGSAILLAGSAGCGKSTVACHFIDDKCTHGEKVVYLSFEESKDQIIRNMKTVGINLEKHLRSGLLEIIPLRPTACGLELHLINIEEIQRRAGAATVVVDPITSLVQMGTKLEVHSMLTRLIDALKTNGCTVLFTYLKELNDRDLDTLIGVSSVMDVWIDIKYVDTGSERNRVISVIKSRGLENSNQLREFVITPKGIQLLDVYDGPAGVLTGSARIAQEEADERKIALDAQKVAVEKMRIEAQASAIQSQIETLRVEYQNKKLSLDLLSSQEQSNREMELKRVDRIKDFRNKG